MNLRFLQLCDSALPIGGFSHSWGLEAAVSQGIVHDAAGLENWARNWLVFSAGPLEGVVMAACFRAAREGDWTSLVFANELLWNTVSPPTLRYASRDMGEQLLGLAQSWPWALALTQDLREHLPEGQWHHAPVFGALASLCGGTVGAGVEGYLHQITLGMISAGVRGIPIGHTHGQQILARLHETIHNLAEDLVSRPLETAGSCCAAYEVLCHEQSKLYTRLFRS